MRVQSIGAAIEPRYPAGNRFLCFAIQMPFGEMDRIAELHDFAQEVGAMAEALQNAGHLLAARLGAPLVIDPGYFTGRVAVFDEFDLVFVVRHDSAFLTAN
jgi:hypothetical protein